ncbi:hypothetical protein BJX68DRAFT_222733 [Aspergillus pseudodeflectus]|uniref:Uncharacterized protein n=1 Tax=Aspergillus pseudodeflectus TaxID=176178 RepID=A0ABR4LAF0_9EURO
MLRYRMDCTTYVCPQEQYQKRPSALLYQFRVRNRKRKPLNLILLLLMILLLNRMREKKNQETDQG